MALSREYFNSIELTRMHRKYYDIAEVDSLLVDIRRQALEMEREIEDLKSELNDSGHQKAELGEAILSARTMANQIILEAKQEAAEIIKNTAGDRTSVDRIRSESQEEIIGRVGEAFEAVKKHYEQGIEETNRLWQDILAVLVSDTEPEDLKQKVGRVASELSEISNFYQ